MTAAATVVVGIPAHDEQDLLGECLAAVLLSARHALDAGSVGRVHVVVVAHRCSDRTAEVVAHGLAAAGGGGPVTGEVVEEDRELTVGQVRDLALRRGLDRVAGHGGAGAPAHSETWLLCTDADTLVPPDWVDALLAAASPGDAAVAGLVDLDAWEVPAAVRAEYERRVAEGLHPGGHWHAYGANLAVRADAYLAVGGFPDRAVGEDVGLVKALRRSGRSVASPTDVRVVTSSRSPGRAHGGLGTLLSTLGGSAAPGAPDIAPGGDWAGRGATDGPAGQEEHP